MESKDLLLQVLDQLLGASRDITLAALVLFFIHLYWVSRKAFKKGKKLKEWLPMKRIYTAFMFLVAGWLLIVAAYFFTEYILLNLPEYLIFPDVVEPESVWLTFLSLPYTVFYITILVVVSGMLFILAAAIPWIKHPAQWTLLATLLYALIQGLRALAME